MFSWRYWFLKKLHPSVLIAFLSAGVLAGVMLSPLVRAGFQEFSWFVAGLLLAASSFAWRRTWLVIGAILAGLLLGLWRGDSQLLKLQAYRPYFGKTVVLSGKIYEDVAKSDKKEAQVQLTSVSIGSQKLPEKVWLSLHTKAHLKRSDYVEVEGKLKPGFGNFAASMSYASLVARRNGADEARDVRDNFSRGVKKEISEPQASLGLGFLVGQRSSLPLELDEQLQIAGLTHIVVASGYNLTILVRLARRLLSRISKYLTAAASFFMIGGFMLVTGLSPSMSRAGLVAGLSLAAWYYGRKVSPFVLLPFVAAITLMANPSFAWGDIGWYLSFAAFGGVMIIAPLLQSYFFGEQKPGFVRQVLGETTAALLATVPIILFVFGQYSPYALPANLLVVPLIPYIMLAVFIGGMASIAVPFAAAFFSQPAILLLNYVTSVTEWVAALPGSQQEAAINAAGLAVYYLVLFLAGFYLWRKTKHDFRQDNIID